MRKLFTCSIALAAVVCIGVGPAGAVTKLGLRGGLGLSPDQFIIGAHLRTDAIAEDLYFVPSFEAGFGDDVTMIALNADLHYKFNSTSKTKPYIGGGLTLNWFDGEDDFGGSVLGGITLGHTNSGPIFLEAKLGLGDVPDAKFIVGLDLR